MHAEPDEYVEQVNDEASFIEFLKILGRDKEASEAFEKSHPSSPFGPSAGGWENTALARFLEAASACGETHLVNKGGIAPGQNPWRVCAKILLSGKYYE